MNLSSPELTERYRQCVDRCLPFWYEHGVDHERGGFFGDVKDDGSLGSDAKGGWYQGFGVWLFAYTTTTGVVRSAISRPPDMVGTSCGITAGIQTAIG